MAGGFNPLIRIKGYTVSLCRRQPVAADKHDQWAIWISSRARLPPDYLLGVLTLGCAQRRLVCASAQQSSRRMWAACARRGGVRPVLPAVPITGSASCIGERAATAVLWKADDAGDGSRELFPARCGAACASFCGVGWAVDSSPLRSLKLIIYCSVDARRMTVSCYVILDYGSTLLVVVLALLAVDRVAG